MESPSHWRALFGLLADHKQRTLLIIAILTITGVLPLAGPLLLAAFIDAAVEGADDAFLWSIAGAFIAVGLARQAMDLAATWSATSLAWTATNDLRSRLARHVLGLDHGFQRSTSPGELVSRVDGDVTSLNEFVSNFATRAATAMVTLVGLLLVTLWHSWVVGIGLSVYLVICVGTAYSLRNRAVTDAADEKQAVGRLLGEVEERLKGADDLRGNGGGSHALATFQQRSATVLRSNLTRERKAVGAWAISTWVFVIGGLGILVVDSILLSRGAISLGTAFLLFQYTQILRTPLTELADQLERAQRAAGGMVRTLQLLDEKSSIVDRGTCSLPPGPIGIDFDSVSFSYPDEDDQRVLHEISFRLSPGTSVGVIGRTGSGKTTLARLVCRLLEPTQGVISMGGLAMGDIAMADLRARTGVISQDVHLFETSIRNNITLFDETITDDEVRQALNELGLLEWIDSMDNGLHTMLGPGGSGVSAGEGQLIALTRLFLRSPDLVILDEASSRVDPITEHRITTAIDRLLSDRTAIIIAHRLSTVTRLDEILVLDQGKIAEHGPTSELQDNPSSHYSQLLAVGSDTIIDEAALDESR